MNEDFKASPKSEKSVFNVIYEWVSPERQWSQKSRDWYVIYGTLFTIIIAALAILGEYIWIIAVIAFVFLWFVQAAIPPEETTHKITSLGVKTYGKLYRWTDIAHFWYSNKGEFILLNLDVYKGDLVTEGKIQRLSLIVSPKEQNETFTHLVKYADYGDLKEVQFNILTRIIYGTHVPVSFFLPEEIENGIDVEKNNEVEESELSPSEI